MPLIHEEPLEHKCAPPNAGAHGYGSLWKCPICNKVYRDIKVIDGYGRPAHTWQLQEQRADGTYERRGNETQRGCLTVVGALVGLVVLFVVIFSIVSAINGSH